MSNKMSDTMRLMDEIDSLREVARRTATQGDDVELLARVREVYTSQGLEADENIFAQAFRNIYGRAPGEQALVALGETSPTDHASVCAVDQKPDASFALGEIVAAALVAPAFAIALSLPKAMAIAIAVSVTGWLVWKCAYRLPAAVLHWLSSNDRKASTVEKPSIVVATPNNVYLEIIKLALANRYKIHVAHDEADVMHACVAVRNLDLVLLDASLIAVVENQHLSGAKAVVFVGAFDTISEQNALTLPGVVGVLPKPLMAPEVKAAVWEHVGRPRMHDSLMTAFAGPF